MHTFYYVFLTYCFKRDTCIIVFFNQVDKMWRFIEGVESLSAGLTLEGDSGEEVVLWLLTSLCTSAKREVEVAL